MAVSKYIKDLVALALQDRVMTFTERQTIIKAAVAENVPKKEIKKYIDAEVAKRMKDSLSKEELQHCPSCGAQVPLFANDCLFCGHTFSDAKRMVVSVTGKAADVIREENAKNSGSQREIKQCPDCGAPFPLISHICTHCGHILHEMQDSAFNADNLIAAIESQRTKLKNIKVPTVGNLLWDWRTVVMFFVGWILICIGEYFGNEKFCLGIGSVLLMCGILGGSDRYRGGTVDVADNAFYDAISNYRMYMRQISTLYGDNPEAVNALGRFAVDMENFKKKRNRNRTWLFVIGFSLFLCGAVPFTISIVGHYLKNN